MHDNIDAAQLRVLLTASNDDLLRELGRTTGHELTPADALRRGRVLFENLKTRLSPSLCSDTKVAQASSAANSDPTLLITAILDCISGFLVGVSPLTAAVLLYRYGIKKLCNESKHSSTDDQR
jgi:hypothetical protein